MNASIKFALLALLLSVVGLASAIRSTEVRHQGVLPRHDSRHRYGSLRNIKHVQIDQRAPIFRRTVGQSMQNHVSKYSSGSNTSKNLCRATPTTSPVATPTNQPSQTQGGATTVYVTKTASTSTSPPTPTSGANSFYIHTLQTNTRLELLDAMKSAGMKVVRIFITDIYANNKGSGGFAVKDLEPDQVGVYDDTILNTIDQLMVEASSRGIKLIISIGDRYALGFWSTDVYATTFGIAPEGSSGDQRIADASEFYTNSDANDAFDNRIQHVLNHRNALMGNKKWSELDTAIYAFEPQNEPMGHMDFVAPSWNCDRASLIKSMIQASGSKILVTTGGGITLDTSVGDWTWNCPSFDIVSVHDYGTDASSTVSFLVEQQKKAASLNKKVVFEEWGATGDSKASIVGNFVTQLKQAGIPWLYWEVVNNSKGSSDFEVSPDDDVFPKLAMGAPNASRLTKMRRRRHLNRHQSLGSPSHLRPEMY